MRTTVEAGAKAEAAARREAAIKNFIIFFRILSLMVIEGFL